MNHPNPVPPARITRVWRHLHANPEPSWAEHATAEYLMELFRGAGLDPRPFAGRADERGTPVDFPGFTVDVGPGAPIVGLRADLDGLAHEGAAGTVLAHSCGHDANMAIVVETMLRLAELGDALGHGVRAIFQPAEERGNGAESVAALGVADGLDVLLGVHLRPGSELPAPMFTPAIQHGACLFARGTITGADHHGARPHLGTNAIEVVAAFQRALADVHVDPQLPASAKLTEVSAGSGNLNVIPGSASFGIDLRAQTNEAMAVLRAGTERIAAVLSELHGVPVTLDYEDYVPAAVIGRTAEELLVRAIDATAGPKHRAPRSVTSGSDDFHFYTLRQPALSAAMLGVGADVSPGLHDAAMVFDTARLAPAADVLLRACLLAVPPEAP